MITKNVIKKNLGDSIEYILNLDNGSAISVNLIKNEGDPIEKIDIYAKQMMANSWYLYKYLNSDMTRYQEVVTNDNKECIDARIASADPEHVKNNFADFQIVEPSMII